MKQQPNSNTSTTNNGLFPQFVSHSMLFHGKNIVSKHPPYLPRSPKTGHDSCTTTPMYSGTTSRKRKSSLSFAPLKRRHPAKRQLAGNERRKGWGYLGNSGRVEGLQRISWRVPSCLPVLESKKRTQTTRSAAHAKRPRSQSPSTDTITQN